LGRDDYAKTERERTFARRGDHKRETGLSYSLTLSRKRKRVRLRQKTSRETPLPPARPPKERAQTCDLKGRVGVRDRRGKKKRGGEKGKLGLRTTEEETVLTDNILREGREKGSIYVWEGSKDVEREGTTSTTRDLTNRVHQNLSLTAGSSGTFSES